MTKEFSKQYFKGIFQEADRFDEEALMKVIHLLETTNKSRKCIYVVGNGGSAATANHFAADFSKNAVKGDEGRFKIISLSENISSVTAYGNDLDYSSVFEEQLKNLLEKGDVLIAISASGNSPNVVKAVEFARRKDVAVVGLTGFTGGRLKQLSDISIHANFPTYEQTEDFHLMVVHMIVYWFKQKYL